MIQPAFVSCRTRSPLTLMIDPASSVETTRARQSVTFACPDLAGLFDFDPDFRPDGRFGGLNGKNPNQNSDFQNPDMLKDRADLSPHCKAQKTRSLFAYANIWDPLSSHPRDRRQSLRIASCSRRAGRSLSTVAWKTLRLSPLTNSSAMKRPLLTVLSG